MVHPGSRQGTTVSLEDKACKSLVSWRAPWGPQDFCNDAAFWLVKKLCIFYQETTRVDFVAYNLTKRPDTDNTNLAIPIPIPLTGPNSIPIPILLMYRKSIPIPIPILHNLGFSIPKPIPILAKTPILQYQYQY